MIVLHIGMSFSRQDTHVYYTFTQHRLRTVRHVDELILRRKLNSFKHITQDKYSYIDVILSEQKQTQMYRVGNQHIIVPNIYMFKSKIIVIKWFVTKRKIVVFI